MFNDRIINYIHLFYIIRRLRLFKKDNEISQVY
jgi:hypothetical protein